jgi:hypothetical protein
LHLGNIGDVSLVCLVDFFGLAVARFDMHRDRFHIKAHLERLEVWQCLECIDVLDNKHH